MDTANFTDDQVVAAVAHELVMAPVRVRQVLEEAGWLALRDEVRQFEAIKDAEPEPVAMAGPAPALLTTEQALKAIKDAEPEPAAELKAAAEAKVAETTQKK